VLICEPHPEVRELLTRIVSRMGHEAVLDDAELCGVEAIVLEPAHAPSVERAQAFRAASGDIPVICASIDLPNGGTRRLDPVAHLVKPFALPDFQSALASALAA
jgi:CheY-like chemotaxis protein